VVTRRVWERSANKDILSRLEHMQRVNYDYATIDFLSSRAALEYFSDLSGFKRIILFAEVEGTHCEAAHTIARDTAKKVHDVLMCSKGRDELETATTTDLLVLRAMEALMHLMDEMIRMLHEEADEMRKKQMKHYLLMKQQAAKENENHESHEVWG
jgi:hypothetical protein